MAVIFETDLSKPIPSLQGSVCVIGVFDGIHRGHQELIGKAIEDAHARDVASVIMTFAQDPDSLLSADPAPKIMSDEQRIEALAQTGADEVVVLDFTHDIAALSAETFLEKAFALHPPAALYVGDDFRFGSQAQGDVTFLASWGAEHGIEVHSERLLEIDGMPVKSTRIRTLLVQGDVKDAMQLLGHPYTVVGRVATGRKEGREMGFCTANLHVPPIERVLGDGVYGGYALVNGKRYRAAISVGVSPTFEDEAVANMEVHILDFTDDIYGDVLAVEIVEYLRPMIKFSNVDDLIATVQADIARIREMLPL